MHGCDHPNGGRDGRHGGHRGRFWGSPRHGGFGRGPFQFSWDMDARGSGRGGPRRRMFGGDELQLVLLALIADQPRHGYDLIKEIEERTGGAYAPSPGVVYPTLTLLADMGHIEEQASEGAKKLYGATAEGQAHLEAKAEEVTALMGRLAELAVMRERTDGGPVRRAMHNLKSALRDRVGRDGVEADTLHDVAAILDEAAQKIERLK